MEYIDALSDDLDFGGAEEAKRLAHIVSSLGKDRKMIKKEDIPKLIKQETQERIKHERGEMSKLNNHNCAMYQQRLGAYTAYTEVLEYIARLEKELDFLF